ncbi:MAG: prolyl oligopeptidase family serine peptidase [Gammaproteobacteria bacterium]|jgi:dipeptidyl aminopeptidase/acylaminoacyl peptidase|nr:prolyl oligopeptidase family serine peptidase [Gammaproteobacteria bacterium]
MLQSRSILGAVLLLLAPPLLAEGMSLEQIARLQSVGEISPSPDGQSIAFTRSVPRDPAEEADGPAWQELHLIDHEGRVRGFVTGDVSVGRIGWTPNGGMITFIAKRGEDEHDALYGIPVDGGEARKLAGAGAGVIDYSFSPDGSRVALVAGEALPTVDEEQREKGFDAVVFEEQWRPRDLWLHDLGGDSEPDRIEIEGSVQAVDWSPAGDRLALRVTPRQLVDDTLMYQRVLIVAPDGEVLGRVDNPGKLAGLAWSDDGSRLALIATETIEDTRAGRLMVTGRDGGDWTHLMPGLRGHVIDIDWDGETLLFLSHEGVESRIGRIAPDGSGEATLLSRAGLIVTAFEARGGRLVFGASTPDYPSEVHALNGESAERLTDSNPWLADVELARQEVVEYPARDGLTIQGLLVRPLDYEEGERYPLILAVHGGPESHYSNGWLTSYNLPAQHAAAEGYFMFYPNYRGSTGRGVEFALSSQGRPAKEEFDDLVDGVDHLIEQGWVDGDRVGITGGSYGGYATAWGATYYSERFAAAVMNVGLSDKIAMLGTSDIPMELYEVHYRTWPWEDWDLYREASPIYYVERAQTPILILHGDADPRVDPTQSRILYRYLTLQEDPPPARLVFYPGEGHGNRRAASRWDYSLRLMRWMNHYLKGEGGEPPPHELDYGPFE